MQPKIKSFSKKALAMTLAMITIFSFIAGTLITDVNAAEKITNPDVRTGIDGIDPNPLVGRHNSYAWAGELFRQDDGDYIWVATNRDLAGHTANRVGIDMNNLANIDPESQGGQLLTLIPPISPDGAARIYRQRASDATAPWELMYADPRINGFRRMIVFDGDLYVIAGLTNTPVANYSYILRFPSNFRPGDRPEIVFWQRLANLDMPDAHLTGSAFEHFRAAAVLGDRLYVGTFDGRVYATDGSGLRHLTPNSGNNMEGWELVVDLANHAVGGSPVVWDLLGFNGSMYIFALTHMGFRVDKVTSGYDGYVLERIVGALPARYPWGLGNPANMGASGFLSTSFDQEYVYVATLADAPAMFTNFATGHSSRVFTQNFNPASIFRFDKNDNWEVVVGDKTGRLAARGWDGNYLPHVGSHRAGFSILPEGRANTSLNQYIWWMAEHNGRLYATTFNLGTIWEYGLWSLMELHGIAPGTGSAMVYHNHIDTWVGLHRLLARDAHLIDFDSLVSALDTYLESMEDAPRYDRRPIVQGYFEIFSAHLPSPDFRQAIFALVNIMLDVIDFMEDEPNWRRISTHMIESISVSAEYFADDTSPAGFDMYVSDDGINFEPITVNGFGNQFNYGGRVLIPSEHGLHVLTANPFFGGQVWRADPMRLEVLPNAPRALTLGRNTMQAMTVLVNDAGAANGSLQVNYDSDLVEVRLTRRPAREVSSYTWDNQVVFNQTRDLWHYEVTETETKHLSVMYDVMLVPLRAGRQDLTLEFEIDGVSASRTIDLTVYFPSFADRTALSEKLEAVSTLNRSDFVVTSWAPFLIAYVDALRVVNNPAASQPQVDRALHVLTAAYNGLVRAEAPPGFRVITTEDQLRAMTRRGNYWLANDITLTRAWNPIAIFEGTLSGNGRTIYNLEITNARAANQGMFRNLSAGATVTDLEIQVGPSGVRGTNNVGVLAGRANRATIIGVRVQVGHDGVVGGRFVGGLVGRSRDTAIVGSFVYGNNGMIELYAEHPEANDVIAIRGTNRSASNVGGLVGELVRSTISHSASYVNVTGYMGVGGVVGHMNSSVINDSFARGHVLGLTTYSRGRHSLGERIGGFIGTSSGTRMIIENVYSSGVVESYGRQHIGPFIGLVRGTLHTRGTNFYDRDVALDSTVNVQNLTNIRATDPVGFVRGGLIGESTHNLQLRSTFTQLGSNWDFETVWTVGLLQGTAFHVNTYPHFIAGIALTSTPPVIRAVDLDDTTITGIGNSEQAIIRVELPDGTELEAITGRDLQWSVDIPDGVNLTEYDEITVTQQELGLPESTESVIVVQVNRPIHISAEAGFENISNEDGSQHLPGDTIRFRVEIANNGEETEHADRIQVINALPLGVTFVPNSVFLVSENDAGDEIKTRVARNTGGVGTSGHSFDATTRIVEVRLGNSRLDGETAIAVEFDVTINNRNTTIGSMLSGITANRVSRTSGDNITAVVVEAERIVIN